MMLLCCNPFNRRHYCLPVRVRDAPGCAQDSLMFARGRPHHSIRSDILISARLLHLCFGLLCISNFLSLLGSLPSIVELFIAFMGRVEKFLVVSCLEIFRREYQIEITLMFALVVVSFAKFLSPELLPLFWCDLYLAFYGSALELERFLLFEFHLFEVA